MIKDGHINKLEDIGFYTLSDIRAKNVSWNSPLKRCELILTDKCNFSCVYCRGVKDEYKGNIAFKEALNVIDLWSEGFVENVRFSGGEPTLWEGLIELVEYTKSKVHIKHIALSTNGSASLSFYKKLVTAGVNDFSISLDACCSSTADKMANKETKYNNIITIIKQLSKISYVTIGIVINNENIRELQKTISLGASLGVSDIRIIPSAQYNQKLNIDIKTKYKILNYRLNNIKRSRHVRGLSAIDCNKCHLVKDDMLIIKNKHYPCVIYMREQGSCIGDIKNKTLRDIRLERKDWFNNHNSFNDPICKKNCLDVCIDYNNKVEKVKEYSGKKL